MPTPLTVLLDGVEQALARKPHTLRPVLVGTMVAALVFGPWWLWPCLGWLLALRYVPLAFERDGELEQERTARSEARAAADAAEAAVRQARMTIMSLRREQARAAEVGVQDDNPADPLHHAVGLHPHSPDWLVVAARKAYRVRLHPDRHPRHRQQAEQRFVRAEQVFEQIYALRGLSG
jgi:hypothetical protein